MASVNRFTYPALTIITQLLWDPNPSIIKVGLYSTFFYLFIIFFYIIYLVEDSKPQYIQYYFTIIILGWHLQLWLQQDRFKYILFVQLLSVAYIGIIIIVVFTTKEVIKVIILTLIYKAPPILVIGLLIYNIVTQVLYQLFSRLCIIKSFILGIKKQYKDNPLLYKQILFLAYTEY